MTDGLVVVDKAPGWTSHDVVGRCRRVFGQRRVGHAGTLDPDATGVLLVGLGQVTRLARFLTPLPKRYVGQVVLGVATSTLDASGEVTGRWDMSHVSPAGIEAAAATLRGPILQVPPMVSALKVDGRRLHQLARAGLEVDRRPRPVTVHRLDVIPTEDPLVLAMDVECSSGTYVRSLAADLGTALGGGAHLRALRRLAVGPFTTDQATPVDQLSAASVLSPPRSLPGLARVQVGPQVAARVAQGAVLDRDGPGWPTGDGPWAVIGDQDRLLAVYEPSGQGRVKPAVVLAAPPLSPGGDGRLH